MSGPKPNQQYLDYVESRAQNFLLPYYSPGPEATSTILRQPILESGLPAHHWAGYPAAFLEPLSERLVVQGIFPENPHYFPYSPSAPSYHPLRAVTQCDASGVTRLVELVDRSGTRDNQATAAALEWQARFGVNYRLTRIAEDQRALQAYVDQRIAREEAAAAQLAAQLNISNRRARQLDFSGL